MSNVPTGHILIVDDDASLNEMLCLHLEDQGHQVAQAKTCKEALEQFRIHSPEIVLLDQQLPDGRGIELLKKFHQSDPSSALIMMTGLYDLELAMDAIALGASDFIHKPIKLKELDHVAGRILEEHKLARQLEAYKPIDTDEPTSRKLVGSSDAMLTVSKEIARAAPTGAPVLIVGESGTGKELVAAAIHAHSGRSGPFIAVNSAAIVDTLLESELFGHEKGAFTGAVSRKLGKFELARDGTLFLDEIGELPLAMQAKLLRVLQEHTFERVGGIQQVTTNARIVAATNRNLEKEVEEKRFRQDLLYRLNVLTIQLPSLRERLEDIPLLVESLLNKIVRSLHKPPMRVEPAALEALLVYDWPGNVRELENVLTQAIVRSDSTTLMADVLPLPDNTGGRGAGALSSEYAVLRSIDEVEAEHVQRVLNHVKGHKGRACEILKISRPALDRKIDKYALRVVKS